MSPLPALLERFEDLPDPRVERSKRHKLLHILFIAIGAVIASAESWKEIEAFAQAKRDWLRKYLELPHGLPSESRHQRPSLRCPAPKMSQP